MNNIKFRKMKKNAKRPTKKALSNLPAGLYWMAIIWVLGLIIPCRIWAQNRVSIEQAWSTPIVAARNLAVSCNKTCMLIFPAAIQSADRGAAYVLATRVAGAENVLKVKAGRSGFAPSSLTVITKDGQVYAFNVSYKSDPPYLVLDFRHEKENQQLPDNVRVSDQQQQQFIPRNSMNAEYSKVGKSGSVQFSGVALNYGEMGMCMETIKDEPAFIKSVHKSKFGVALKLEGIYFNKEVLFFKFRLHNKAGIPYKFESLRLFIRDNRQSKRTAIQDQEMESLAIKSWGLPEQNNNSVGTIVNGQQIIVAVPRFTIADGKKLAIILREENGDRNMTLKVKERIFRKTKDLIVH